jgi:hypothetical protein
MCCSPVALRLQRRSNVNFDRKQHNSEDEGSGSDR